MKPKNWRRYWSYRPNWFVRYHTWTNDEVRDQEAAYIAWLAKARKWSKDKAERYARSQPTNTLISATNDREANVRTAEAVDFAEFSPRCYIRTVRCHYTKEHYEFSRWMRYRKPDAPTTYAVMLDGRCVNSFLSKAAAKRWTLAKLQAAQ